MKSTPISLAVAMNLVVLVLCLSQWRWHFQDAAPLHAADSDVPPVTLPKLKAALQHCVLDKAPGQARHMGMEGTVSPRNRKARIRCRHAIGGDDQKFANYISVRRGL